MDLIIEKDRAKTVDKLPSSALSWYRSALEGRKTFSKDEKLSFEATGSNLEKWKERFPHSKIVDEGSLKVFESEGVKSDRPKFSFKREPLDFQQTAFDKLRPKNVWSIWGATGTGKSFLITTLGCSIWCDNKIDAILLVSLNGVVMAQWHDMQLPRDVPDDVPYQSWVWSKTKKAQSAYDELKTFDGLQVVNINIDALNTKDGYALCLDFIKSHNGKVLMVIDESQAIKSPNSQRTKRALELGGMCDYRAIASGTPLSKNLTDLWQQFKFLDERIIGIKYKTTFEREYCELKTVPFSPQPIVTGPKLDKLDQLHAKMEPYVFRITKEELGFKDFDDEFTFDLGLKEMKHFQEVKKTFMTQLENGEFLTVTNAISSLVRLQQISNGFLVGEDGKTEELECSRLNAMNAYIETLSDEKIVIWCRFRKDVELVLRSLGKEAVDLSGAVSAEERTHNKNEFINNKKIRFTVGTPKAAGIGTDGLQTVSNRAIYYSNSEHALDYWQSRARTSRIGGDMNAFYGHLIANKTPDKKILANLKNKTDLLRMSLDEVRGILFDES